MVDIQVLCDYLDRLCAMLVVAGCSQSRGMDNVVLPENWFALIAPHIQVLSRKYTNKLWMYAGIVEGFLLQLHHGVSIGIPIDIDWSIAILSTLHRSYPIRESGVWFSYRRHARFVHLPDVSLSISFIQIVNHSLT